MMMVTVGLVPSPFNGYSLVWYKGHIIAGFESTEDNWAKKSVFATARRKGWICRAYDGSNDSKLFDYIGFVDITTNVTHEFYIIKVKSVPDVGTKWNPVDTYLRNDLLP